MSKTIIVINEDTIEELTDVKGYPIPMVEVKEMLDNICSNFNDDRFSYFVRYGEFDGEEIGIVVIGTAENISEEDLEFFAGDYQEALAEEDIENMPVEPALERAVFEILDREEEEWDSDEEEEPFDDEEEDYLDEDVE